MNTPLSPAAQAVLDAATPALNNFDACGFNHQHYDRKAIAAAFRAAADQVVPDDPQEAMHFTTEAIRLNKQGIRCQILAIATELEGAQ